MHLIAGAGIYVAIAHPPWVAASTVAQLTERLIRSVRTGIDDTTIRAGVLGELRTSSPINPDEIKVLQAAAHAHESAEGQNRTGDTMIFSHVLYQLSYLGTSRYSKPVTPVVLVTIVVALVLAGLAGFVGRRLSTGRGGGTTTVAAVYLLAITLSIVAIFSVTFIRKTVGG